MPVFWMLRKTVAPCLSLMLALALWSAARPGATETLQGSAGSVVTAATLATFDQPWAMTFLPDGRMLVSEKPGRLKLVDAQGGQHTVRGVPEVAYGGQGGLGDIILHPRYARNRLVYLSFAEQGTGEKGERTFGAAVMRAKLDPDTTQPELREQQILWRQLPKTSGRRGHYGHRLAFGPDGMLFITSGDRQRQVPAQNPGNNLGAIIRLRDDGTPPDDNPLQDLGDIARTFWSYGHRNPLGIAFDDEGRLWSHEMGPRHGDEFNLIVAGANYGWPTVSWGDNYSGKPIPDHDTRPDFEAPAIYWDPGIAPSGLIIYRGDMFTGWRGDALLGALAGKRLVRIALHGTRAEEVEHFTWPRRIREVEEGPDGAIYLLEDGDGGRLLRLGPVPPG